MNCLICNNHFNNLFTHVKVSHKLSKKEYHIKYLNSDPKLFICKNPSCNNEVLLEVQYCSCKCRATDPVQKSMKIETVRSRYGVSNISQSNIIKQKKVDTMQTKYGVSNPIHIEGVKEKMQSTIKSRYGVEYISQSSEIKNKKKATCNKRYGVDNPSQSDIVKRKKVETVLRNYGVSHQMHVPEVYDKVFSKSFQIYSYTTKFGDTVTYQSLLELAYIHECENLNIRILDGDIIDYEYRGTPRKYYVDFKILDGARWNLVEIKAAHPWHYDDIRNGKYAAKYEGVKNFLKLHLDYSDFIFILNNEIIDIRDII